MKNTIGITLGFILFFFSVFRPIQADLLTGIANRYPLSIADKQVILAQAARLDQCNGNILNLVGDSYFADKNATMAAIHYGNAMLCSPGSSLIRFKFAEALFMLGVAEGKLNLDEALKLEPNNPFYRQENERITKILQPSP